MNVRYSDLCICDIQRHVCICHTVTRVYVIYRGRSSSNGNKMHDFVIFGDIMHSISNNSNEMHDFFFEMQQQQPNA